MTGWVDQLGDDELRARLEQAGLVRDVATGIVAARESEAAQEVIADLLEVGE